jgi:hypothetical protein
MGKDHTEVLRRADGTVVPTTPDGIALLRLQGPLEEGKDYTLDFNTNCATPKQSTFHAGPPAPWPTSIGEVSVSPHWEWLKVAYAQCSEPMSATGVHFSIDPSPELRPFLPVTRWSIRADDVEVTASLVGKMQSDFDQSGPDVVTHYNGFPNARLTCGVAHVVDLVAELAGGAIPPLVERFSVTLECPPSEAGADAAFDGGIDATHLPPQPREAGTDDGAGYAAGGGGASGGCALAGTRRQPSAAAGLMILATLLAFGARRSRFR